MAVSDIPTEVRIDDRRATVTLTWEDGHQSAYPFWYLRGLCPCAACQGHGGGLRFIPSDKAALTRAGEVGHYAINLVWDVTHDTGIYAFDYLRSLCPCGTCRAGNPALSLLPAERRAELQAAAV